MNASECVTVFALFHTISPKFIANGLFIAENKLMEILYFLFIRFCAALQSHSGNTADSQAQRVCLFTTYAQHTFGCRLSDKIKCRTYVSFYASSNFVCSEEISRELGNEWESCD